MKLFSLTLAAAPLLTLPLIGKLGTGSVAVVHAFQMIVPPTTAARAAKKMRSDILVSPVSSRLYSSTAAEEDLEQINKEKTEIQQKIDEITEALEEAERRQEEAQGEADKLREERKAVAVESESIIDRLKRGFIDQIDDLTDQIEGAQDGLRTTKTQTQSDISNIQGEGKEREGELKAEIAELESRLNDLRKDAARAVKERDQMNKSIQKDARGIRSTTRKDLEELKASVMKEKKDLTRKNWELESRIQQAQEDKKPAMKELEEEKQFWLPKINPLKDRLKALKQKLTPQVDELKEKRRAKEMFFDQSLKGINDDKKEELNVAKSVFEEEMDDEDQKLENATSYYDSQMGEKEKELLESKELADEPVEMSGFSAISQAQKDLAALGQEKLDAISRQQDDRVRAVQDAVESQKEIQDQYDAELEKGMRDLEQQKDRAIRRLQNEDTRRESRKAQLTYEMEDLTNKLSQLMKDEREAAKVDYQNLKKAKTTELANSRAQSKGATNEIQTMRSNLLFVQDELKRLEDTSREKELVLSELEEERASFRKQARRTVVAAFGRITRRR